VAGSVCVTSGSSIEGRCRDMAPEGGWGEGRRRMRDEGDMRVVCRIYGKNSRCVFGQVCVGNGRVFQEKVSAILSSFNR
jgi:hypothetical protein